MVRLLIGCINFNNRVFTEIWIKTLHKTLNRAGVFEDHLAGKYENPGLYPHVKVVVLDNGSDEDQKIFDLKEKYPWVEFIFNKENAGVAAGWNQLIKAGYDENGKPMFDYYMPANNDIYFTEDWYENFVKCLEADTEKEFGWISSFINDYKEPDLTGVTETVQLENIYWSIRPQADDIESVEQMENIIKIAYAPFGGIEKFAGNLKAKYGLKLKNSHQKAPLFALSKEVIAKVGLFDEYNSPSGLHEDADYGLRIELTGLRFGATYGAYAHHFSMMSRTKGKFKERWWIESRDKAFEEKWGLTSKELDKATKNNMRFRLDIGSGERPKREDGKHWYHLDIDKQFSDVEFLHDASQPLPFEDESLLEIYCSNNLEHQEWKYIDSILFNWYQKLVPGGKIEIRVPNFEFAVRRYLEGSWKLSLTPCDFNLMHLIFGGDHPGCPHLHKVGFDFNNLSGALKDIGFQDIKNTSQEGSWELRIEAIK